LNLETGALRLRIYRIRSTVSECTIACLHRRNSR
jgi:hypothetical protein